MVVTNYSYDPASPPFAGYDEYYELPAGLTLTVPDNGNDESAPEAAGPEEDPALSKTLEIDTLYGEGGWALGYFHSGLLHEGDAITGAGSITTKAVPFNLFTPGTFLIEAGYGGGMGSESDSSVEESLGSAGGVYPYSITYKVIPLKASLNVSGPGAFPKTILGKTSRAQQVKITNNGSAPLTDLNLSIAGRGARDFSPSALSLTSLPAGASTLVDVRFRPKRTGKRRATLTVNGLYTPPAYPEIPILMSVEEDAPEPVTYTVPTPVVVSGSTTLTGKGLSGKTLRPHSPRFPRGRR